MKRTSVHALLTGALILAAAPLFAENGSTAGRGPRVVTRPGASVKGSGDGVVKPKDTGIGYSVQVNIVTRVQGTSFFRTAIDITNNTTQVDPITATYQYCFRLSGVYQCSTPDTISLFPLDSFHEDDFVDYLGANLLIPPAAQEQSFGTLLVTFGNLPSGNGWEGTVTARTYSPYDQNNAALGTVAIAYPGSLFFESARGSLVGLVRDTLPAPTEAGALRTNLGITNTDIHFVGAVSVALSFYDVTPNSPTNGQQVGTTLTMDNLLPGEVRQINNVFTAAAIPANVEACIVFADITAGDVDGTIEGYINILDDDTKDGAYFEMKCSLGCPSF